MLFIQKVEQFGDQFFADYVFINGINDHRRKILMADTYFSILQGKKVGSDFEYDQIV